MYRINFKSEIQVRRFYSFRSYYAPLLKELIALLQQKAYHQHHSSFLWHPDLLIMGDNDQPTLNYILKIIALT